MPRFAPGWHALALTAAVGSLLALASVLDVRTTMAHGDRVDFFAMLIQGILTVVGGVLFYLTWRINRVPAFAWLAAALIFLGLQDFPFLLAQFSNPQNNMASRGEGSEVVAALVLLVCFVQAARGAPMTAGGPALVGFGGAALMAVVRLWVHDLPAVPDGFVEGTAWYERAMVAAICLAVLAAVLRTRVWSPHTRGLLAFTVIATGVQCTVDTAHDPAPEHAPAFALALLVLGMGMALLDAGVRSLLDTLSAHQQAMESVAHRVLEAEARAHREADLLHEVRSTVGGLAHAQQMLLDQRDLSVDQRRRLQAAMAEQLRRIDRSLHLASHEIQSFDVSSVLDPVIEFQRAAGHEICWQPPADQVVVRHVPDAVAQVLGTLLHNAGRHAPGQPIAVTVQGVAGEAAIEVSQPGPEISAEVLPRLFERGAHRPDSPGQGLGLHVARRLLTEHSGDLHLACSGPTRTAFTMVLPRGHR